MSVNPLRKRISYSILIAALSSIIMGIVSIQYSDYVNRRSQQQWCEVIRTLDDAYKATPPQTPAGRRLAEEFARMRVSFDCGR